MAQPGWATEEGTLRYTKRLEGKIPQAHFRQAHGLWLSSIGIGTYLGNHDDAADDLYKQAVIRTLELGGNVIDSAINYRFQRSERAIGTALSELGQKGLGRSEIVIATKGGFIPFDGAPPQSVRSYFEETFVRPGIAGFADVIQGCHCMTPKYLLHQLEQSRRNLGLDCIDIYYVHNPETQLAEISRGEFSERLWRAFEALEGAVAQGKIRMYGTATWNGYRNDPSAKDYLSLVEVAEIARKAGGERHHFKVIQLPLNLAMAEAFTSRNQELGGEKISTLEAAQRLDITVMSSASILQGQLARELPAFIGEVFDDLRTDAQRSLQFVRSTPGVTVALVGMKQIRHVEENFSAAQIPPASLDQYTRLFKAASSES
ncbi:MAG: aldo/keto reductase [Deltaproteobacteria bacterium]|nr:aldo/keto reductase [Deltaproteobacteria bacterium]